MPTTVIYARKSSESEDRQVLSIDAQVREMQALAVRHGLSVEKVLTESKSAKAPGRPIFDALMRRVYKGEIHTIVSWKMDRLTRNHKDSGNLLHALAEGLIQQVITIDGVKTPSGNDRLMGSMELAFATKFIDDLRVNTKRGLEERLSRGWVAGVAPPGYLNDPVSGTIVSDPKRLPLIRKMFDLFLSGTMRPEQIRQLANEKWGFRTVQRKRSGGKPLSRSSVYRILSHPFYAGLIPSKGRLLPGKHEPIITWEEFQRVQMVLHRDGRQRPQRHEFAFTGIFKCGVCGAAMTAEEHVKRSGRRYVYYRCVRNRATVNRCAEPAVPESEVINQLANTFGRLSIPPPVLKWLKAKALRVAESDRARGEMVRQTLQESLQAAEREGANLLDLRIRNLVPDAVYLAKNQEIEQRKVSLRGRLTTSTEAGEAVARQVTELLEFAANVKREFLAGPGVRQRAILEAVGSNYLLKARKVSFHLEKPLSLVSEASGCSNWLRICDDVRTWFLTTTQYFRVPQFHDPIEARSDSAA